MTSITCPHCSRVGKLKNAVAVGSKVRCPGCRESFTVQIVESDDEPETFDLGIDLGGGQALDRGVALDGLVVDAQVEGSTSTPTTPDVAPAPKPVPKSQPTGLLDYPQLPFEPWFYRWIERFADNLWLLGVGLCLLVAGVVAILILLAALGSNSAAILGYGFLFLLAVIPSFFSLFLTSTLLMLAVDHARNVRATWFLLQGMASRQHRVGSPPPVDPD